MSAKRRKGTEQTPRADPTIRQEIVYCIANYFKSSKRKWNSASKLEAKFLLKKRQEGQGAAIFKLMRKKRGSYSLLPNLLAMIGRTSSASIRVSKKGSNETSAQSDGSSNQLFIGIPLLTCNRKTWNDQNEIRLKQSESGVYPTGTAIVLFLSFSFLFPPFCAPFYFLDNIHCFLMSILSKFWRRYSYQGLALKSFPSKIFTRHIIY